jgi:virginiamycin A acetyltransferase
MTGPRPNDPHPMAGAKRVVYLKNLITSPKIVVGDYTYYDDQDERVAFESENVLYHFGDEKLIIGRFCAIAHRVKFIMNGANHQMTGFSTYPFFTFRQGWETAAPGPDGLPSRGDTVIGNDVWIGYDAMILSGVTVGDGAIIAARAVVAKDVEPYTVVAGNPAEQKKERFPRDVAAELVRISWWDWPADKITRNLAAITGADLTALRRAV